MGQVRVSQVGATQVSVTQIGRFQAGVGQTGTVEVGLVGINGEASIATHTTALSFLLQRDTPRHGRIRFQRSTMMSVSAPTARRARMSAAPSSAFFAKTDKTVSYLAAAWTALVGSGAGVSIPRSSRPPKYSVVVRGVPVPDLSSLV